MRVGINRRTAIGVFLLSLVLYSVNGRILAPLDSLPARLQPFGLLTRGTLYLDPFEQLLQTIPVSYFYTRTSSGHLLSMYPVVLPVLITPLYAPAAALVGGQFDTARFAAVAARMEKTSATVIAALSVTVMFLLLGRVATATTAGWLTLAYALGTETWVIASQALWQHGLSELLLAGVMLSLATGTGRSLAFAGFLGGLLALNRLPNLLFVAGAALYVLAYHRRRLPIFIAAATTAAAPFLLYNLLRFQHPYGAYAGWTAPGLFHWFDHDHLSGVAGLLVSPGRGLVVFAPFFVFLFAWLHRPTTRPIVARLLLFLAPAAAIQLCFYGAFVHWGGGDCYGPRYLTDMTPVLILALAPVVDGLRRRWARASFAGLVVAAVTIQAIGAFWFPRASLPNPNAWKLKENPYVSELRSRFAHWRLPIRFVLGNRLLAEWTTEPGAAGGTGPSSEELRRSFLDPDAA